MSWANDVGYLYGLVVQGKSNSELQVEGRDLLKLANDNPEYPWPSPPEVMRANDYDLRQFLLGYTVSTRMGDVRKVLASRNASRGALRVSLSA